MIETPTAARNAAKIAKHASFLSFGTNDLAQLIYRIGHFDVRQLIESFPSYKVEYNKNRPHQSLDGQPPLKSGSVIPMPLNQIKNHKKTFAARGLVTRFELVA